MTARYLIFEDGTVFAGDGFGAPAVTFGTVVFNTSMFGYQEIITNQIYNNQILVFTQPNIGSTGIQRNIYETIVPTIKGVVVRSLSNITTNNVRRLTLDQYLKQMNIPGITNIDTRAIVHKLREGGPMKGSIVPVPDDHAFDQLHATVLTSQQVAQVATPKPYPNPGVGKSVVVIDFGLKNGVLRQLSRRKCNVTVLPYTATTDEILRLDPDGVVLSTGPGDPNKLPASVLTMIREIEEKIPTFGIGLGHELFAMANGAKLTKLLVEHHGMNHPIHEVITDHVVYATQGAGYAVDPATIDRSKLFVTYTDMIDGSIQGLRHREFPAFSVQFFPDGAPGPDETNAIFDEFIEIMNRREAQR
ncbi:MAG: carbamoyl phosphate synthase small subunit [Limosilactobacillus sp.]|uniref:carbamoyl phosphate synthase small subunit n=1 Tax=Limosilactobacillus sp. TaxID=2773925 RepID=UPI0026FA1913|nr:carbamoyl phosphate synthase small subunit [Limosilactobacillus sp.]